MTEAHSLINSLSDERAQDVLLGCCASSRWVEGMLASRPFVSKESLHAAADRVWAGLAPKDVLEAFAGHPKIGGDLQWLRKKYTSTSSAVEWSENEQSSVAHASEHTLERLRAGNAAYEQRFGYIFIVCATGKSAAEMAALLEQRLPNPPAVELRIAAAEQAKITHLRLEKLTA